MKQYKVQITDRALADMEEIYNYIAIQLRAPENAIGQYNRIANAIEELNMFPEKVRLNNYSVFYVIENERVIIMRVLYSASDIETRLKL